MRVSQNTVYIFNYKANNFEKDLYKTFNTDSIKN